MEYIFVYGTLRPPQKNTPLEDSRYYPRVAPYLISTEWAVLDGADLYDLGSYPAARPGQHTIRGEVLGVAPEALALLDRIEGHPLFFRRERVSVRAGDRELEAWIYWAPESLVQGRRRILSGDWFDRDPGLTAGTGPLSGADSPQYDEHLLKIVERLAAAQYSWLTTVRPDGRPHSVPIWHVWHDTRIYVLTKKDSVKAGNIRENPAVVINLPDPVEPVILEGWATTVNSRRSIVKPLFKGKYDWDIDSDPDYDTLLEITPLKLLSWDGQDQRRWRGITIMQAGEASKKRRRNQSGKD